VPTSAPRKKLLGWYRRSRRDLPWRKTRDPYRIWVSEVMLQQTRVQTVIPYYERFVESFPDLESLAGADEEKVLKAWEGLGYYRRVRNLQSAAREVTERYGGKLPRSSAELETLPGFGPYTSAAVGSIAFGEPVAVVDGNVRRVLSRLFAKEGQIDRAAQEFLDPGSPGDFNQAVMELGALICLPRAPRCSDCPLRRECRALREGTVGRFPPPPRKTKMTRIFCWTFVLRSGERWFLRKRPAGGRWGGMWEFPTTESASPLPLRRAAAELGLPPVRLLSAGGFRHLLSHQELSVRVACGRILRKEPRIGVGKWVTLNERSGLALSRLSQKAYRLASVPGS
jgi:A/G-specific adenine glycosylase